MSDPNSFRTLLEKVKAETEVHQIKLPTSVKSLGDVLSADAIHLHYDVLYKNYVKKAMAGEGEFQFAGAKLHTQFFEQFRAATGHNAPGGAIKILIDKKFGSYAEFKTQFKDAALGIHGSGWVYLDTSGKIHTIPNHKVVSNVAVIIDMWEHSYIIDYGSDKEKYIDSMWKIINWDIINARLN